MCGRSHNEIYKGIATVMRDDRVLTVKMVTTMMYKEANPVERTRHLESVLRGSKLLHILSITSSARVLEFPKTRQTHTTRRTNSSFLLIQKTVIGSVTMAADTKMTTAATMGTQTS